MKKDNLQIELECSLNWLEVYRVTGVTDWHVVAMRAHVRELRRRMTGKYDA